MAYPAMQADAPHASSHASLSGRMTEEKARRAIYKLPDTDRAAACQRHGQEAWDAMTWTQRLEASGGGGEYCEPQRPPIRKAPLLKTVEIVRSGKGTVGLRIFRNDDLPSGPWHILQVAPNSPAGNAGCKVGDAILAIDGKSVVNLGLHETNGLFAGFPDSIVSVLLKDDPVMRLRMPAVSFHGLVETFAKVKEDPPSGSRVLSKEEEAEAIKMLERAEPTRQERTHLSVEASVGWVFSNSSGSPRLERSSPANPAKIQRKIPPPPREILPEIQEILPANPGNPPPALDLPGDAVLRMMPSAPGRPYLADYPSHQNGNISMYHAASSRSLDKDTMACSDKTTPKVSCDSASYISAHSEAIKPLLIKSPAEKTDSAQRRWGWLPCCLAPKQHNSPVSLYMSTDGSLWTCWPCCRLEEQKRKY